MGILVASTVWSNWNILRYYFSTLVFLEGRRPEYLEKNAQSMDHENQQQTQPS